MDIKIQGIDVIIGSRKYILGTLDFSELKVGEYNINMIYINNFMLDGLTSFGVLVALTSGVVQVVKKIGVENKWLPLIALFVGILLTFLGGAVEITTLSVLTGIAVGLSAVGLFENLSKAKKVVKGE